MGATSSGLPEAKKQMDGASRRVTDLRPVMRVAAEDLRTFTSDMFSNETDPEGKKWADLSPEYAAKRRTGTGGGPDIKILTDTARMRNSHHGTAFVDGMEFGFSAEYAEAHHKGIGVTKRRIAPVTDSNELSTEGPGGRFWSGVRRMVERFVATGRVV